MSLRTSDTSRSMRGRISSRSALNSPARCIMIASKALSCEGVSFNWRESSARSRRRSSGVGDRSAEDSGWKPVSGKTAARAGDAGDDAHEHDRGHHDHRERARGQVETAKARHQRVPSRAKASRCSAECASSTKSMRSPDGARFVTTRSRAVRSNACGRTGACAVELQARHIVATKAAATPSGRTVPAQLAAYSHHRDAPRRRASSIGVARVTMRRASAAICVGVTAGGSKRRSAPASSRCRCESLGLIRQPRWSGASAFRS